MLYAALAYWKIMQPGMHGSGILQTHFTHDHKSIHALWSCSNADGSGSKHGIRPLQLCITAHDAL